MTEKDFIIWLHGYLEISGAKNLGEKELQVIKDHLNTFFIKVTPDRDKQPTNHQEVIDEILDDMIKKNPYKKCDPPSVIPSYPVFPPHYWIPQGPNDFPFYGTGEPLTYPAKTIC
jgi:hypothetical protein